MNIYFLSSIINLKNLISFFLIIHASFFLIEFFSYYIFKYQISFYELFWQGGEGVAGPHLESENLKYWWNYIRIKGLQDYLMNLVLTVVSFLFLSFH